MLVTSAQATSPGASGEISQRLINFLGDTGFVLYQLILEGARDIAAATFSGLANSRAIRALEQAGARFALEWLSDREEQQCATIPEALVNRCIGWLLEQEAELAHRKPNRHSRSRRDAPSDAIPADDQGRTVATLMQALEAEVHSSFPMRALVEAGRTVANPTSEHKLSARAREIWDRLPAAFRARAEAAEQAGDVDSQRAAFEAAVALDPCDIQSLFGLAWSEARQGDDEKAAYYVRKFCTLYSCSSSYNYAVSLVTSNGILATRVRDILLNLARAEHATPAAFRALAKLERRVGDERAARRWDRDFEALLDSENRFFGYPNDLTE